MRTRVLSLLALITLPLTVPSIGMANEAQLIMPPTPWDDEQPVTYDYTPDIKPKRLSIADLTNNNSANIGFQQVSQPGVAASRKKNIKPSALETLYSERIIDELEQYGYDLFDQDTTDLNTLTTIPAGTVQSDYILSSGDSINIIIRGQFNTRRTYEIDNRGMLIIEEFNPINAAGRRLRDVQTDLQSQAGQMHNTQVFTSLAGVRQIGVLVVGHVHRPGRKNLTAFHSVLDALTLAGGIEKTGSLRQIKLVRNGRSHFIDFYQLLMASGKGADKLLRDGDRLIVPPIGATMAVSGSVKRPAIYEIRKGESLSLHQSLGLAGGALTPGQNRYMKLEFTSNGEETVADIDKPDTRIFGDGSILSVAQSEQARSSEITLSGNTRQPGSHDLKKSKTLVDLINDKKVLGKNIYPLIAVIERQDSKHLTKKLIAFSPHQVLNKEYNADLDDGDDVRLFSMVEIRALDENKQNGKTDNPLLHKASLSKQAKREIIEDPVLAAFLKERAAFVRGAVRQSGAYPVIEGTSLENLLAVAGGIALEANKENIELSSRDKGRRIINLETDNAAQIFIEAGDTIRVNQKFHKIADQSVTLIGEVQHPGKYDLMPGDTMLSLLERAGGLSQHAYPDGAIFSRASERKREEARYKAEAQNLELQLAAGLKQSDNDNKLNTEQISATQSLITRLKNAKAVGRITVEADPASLVADSEQDILLETGDKDRTFVIYPDGSAQPLNVSTWNHRAAFIPPGSTIIVPRDPEPFNFLNSATKVASLFANLAISGLYIDAIGDDD